MASGYRLLFDATSFNNCSNKRRWGYGYMHHNLPSYLHLSMNPSTTELSQLGSGDNRGREGGEKRGKKASGASVT